MTHRPPGLYEELITHRLEAALEEGRLAGLEDEIATLVPPRPSIPLCLT